MVESRKVRKLLDGKKFGPTNAGKATVLACSQISNSLSSTTYYLTQFTQKKIRFALGRYQPRAKEMPAKYKEAA